MLLFIDMFGVSAHLHDVLGMHRHEVIQEALARLQNIWLTKALQNGYGMRAAILSGFPSLRPRWLGKRPTYLSP